MKYSHIVAVALLAGCPGFGGTSSNGLFEPPVPSCPTYDTHVRIIMEAYCVECHGEVPANGGPPGLRLDLYSASGDDSGTVELADRIVFRGLDSGNPMPPLWWTYPQLDPLEIEIVENWITAGHPETAADCGDAP